MIERKALISIRRQCELLGVSRRTFYYKPKVENRFNQKLMELIEAYYFRDPTSGSRKITVYLRREGYKVNRKRVQRLMKKMGLKGICPPRRTTKSDKVSILKPENFVRHIVIKRPNQVWYTDITYMRLQQGFCYVVAIMDAYSKKVLSIKSSNILDRHFCVEAAEEAVRKYGYPEIIHADRGKQFLSREFLKVFMDEGGNFISKLSFGDRGFKNNIYIERFWRSYKYECLRLYEVRNLRDVREITSRWVEYYNRERVHQGLGYLTPDEVYHGARRGTEQKGWKYHLRVV